MSDLGALGLFILLALLLPGIVILGAAAILFPEWIANLSDPPWYLVLGVVFMISVILANPPFYLERIFLHRIWERLYPSWSILKRHDLFLRRNVIIAKAEKNGVRHDIYDQILGEHILFTNTSLWVLVLGVARFFVAGGTSESRWVAVGMIFLSLVTLLGSAPFFKKSYLEMLEYFDTLP